MTRPMIRVAATLLCSAIFLATLVAATAPPDPVRILKVPATSATQPYDPRHIPPQMPPTIPGEAGVTVSKFGCVALVQGTVIDQFPGAAQGQTHVSVRIDAVQITLHLDIREWVSDASGQKILAHEDGHRIISEHFYDHADAVAAELAHQSLGKIFTADGSDPTDAARKSLTTAARALADAYMQAVRDRSQRVQAAYDKITAHGTNSIDEMDAINQALKEIAHDPK